MSASSTSTGSFAPGRNEYASADHSEEQVAERHLRIGRPRDLGCVDQPDERQHRTDGGRDRGVQELLLEDEGHHRAEDQADQHRALTERLQALVDDAGTVERVDADLVRRRPSRVQRVVDQTARPLRQVRQDRGDHSDRVQSGTAWNACAPISNPM